MTSAIEPASELAVGRRAKKTQKGITGILTLYVKLTIILDREGASV